MGHRKPIFVPLKTPTGSKDPRVVVIDGVPRSWTQSSFLRSFAEAYSYVEIRSVRRLHLGGWLLRLANAETAERLIGEVIRPLKHEKDAIADCLRIHRIGERTPHAIHKSEQISRQLFSTIDPQSLDCMVEIDLPEQDERMIEEGRQGEKSLDKLIEEERSTEKSLLLRAIAKKIDECLSIDESHKIIALNLRGAFLVEFESVKDADNYLEKGLPFRALGCLLKCRRNVADIRASTNFCKRCCNVGHLDITCKRAQMCRVCGEKGHSSLGAKCPKKLVHHHADPQNPSLFVYSVTNTVDILLEQGLAVQPSKQKRWHCAPNNTNNKYLSLSLQPATPMCRPQLPRNHLKRDGKCQLQLNQKYLNSNKW